MSLWWPEAITLVLSHHARNAIEMFQLVLPCKYNWASCYDKKFTNPHKQCKVVNVVSKNIWSKQKQKTAGKNIP